MRQKETDGKQHVSLPKSFVSASNQECSKNQIPSCNRSNLKGWHNDCKSPGFDARNWRSFERKLGEECNYPLHSYQSVYVYMWLYLSLYTRVHHISTGIPCRISTAPAPLSFNGIPSPILEYVWCVCAYTLALYICIIYTKKLCRWCNPLPKKKAPISDASRSVASTLGGWLTSHSCLNEAAGITFLPLSPYFFFQPGLLFAIGSTKDCER